MKSVLSATSGRIPMPKVNFKGPKKEVAKYRGKFVGAFQKAVFKTESNIGYWLDEAMDESTWNWKGTTFRANGTTVSSPRNIVDTGELKRSKKLSTKFGSTQATYTVKYTAPYAKLVHYGGYITPYGRGRNQVYIPGRPWIDLIFREDSNFGDSDRFDFLGEIKDQMKDQLGK